MRWSIIVTPRYLVCCTPLIEQVLWTVEAISILKRQCRFLLSINSVIDLKFEQRRSSRKNGSRKSDQGDAQQTFSPVVLDRLIELNKSISESVWQYHVMSYIDLFEESISLLLHSNLLRAPLPRSRLISGSGAATTTAALLCQPYVRQPQAPHPVHTAIMALPQSAYKDRQFLAVIGDEVCAHSIFRRRRSSC